MDDTTLFYSYIKLLIALPLVLGLAYLSLKYGGRYLRNAQRTRNIEVLERVVLQKNASLFVVKVGEDYHLMGVTDQEIRLLKELDYVPEVRPEADELKSFREYMKDSVEKLRRRP
jgi:flagellar protein FliO/FliZ